jgi:hypothetical protein
MTYRVLRMEPRTTVVHLKRKNGVEVVSCDTYIGRAMYQGGWRLPGSKWANPFKLDQHGSRAAVLLAYETHVRKSPELMAALPELRGKRLGCWCVGPRCLVCHRPRGACGHLSCHGEVLVMLLEELEAAEVEAAADPSPSPIPDDDPLWAELGL